MPVLEAMAAGIPVACSRISPLKEIGGDAVLYFDPADEDQIETTLERIVSDENLRARLSIDGPKRAREFTWQSAARLTLSALIPDVSANDHRSRSSS
jgi:glycosyltransferase involved in cell wall biosynthesis